MEKDSKKDDINKDEPGSDDSLSDFNVRDVQYVADVQAELLTKQIDLTTNILTLNESLKLLNQFLSGTLPLDKVSELKRAFPDLPVPGIDTPILKSEKLSEGKVENLPDKPVLAEGLKQSVDRYNPVEDLEKQANYISDRLKTSSAILEFLKPVYSKSQAVASRSDSGLSNRSRPEHSDNETQASASCVESDTSNRLCPQTSDYETQTSALYSESKKKIISRTEANKRYREYFKNQSRKGKEAASERYRYKKRSKSDDSSRDGLKDSPLKTFEETLVKLEPKAISDSSEKSLKRKLDENSAGPSEYSKLSGSDAEDDADSMFLKRRKKGCLSLSEMLDAKDYESLDLASFMDSPGTDRSSNKGEDSSLASTIGPSYSYKGLSPPPSPIEKSNPTSGREELLPSRKDPFIPSLATFLSQIKESSRPSTTDFSASRRSESSHQSVSNFLSNKIEESLQSVSGSSLSGREESSHPSVSDLQVGEIKESSRPSVIQSSVSETKESSGPSASDLQISETKESSRTSVSDLSVSGTKEFSLQSTSQDSSAKDSSR